MKFITVGISISPNSSNEKSQNSYDVSASKKLCSLEKTFPLKFTIHTSKTPVSTN
jgi:hypothetical protein